MNDQLTREREMFDRKFGMKGPEGNSDSTIRQAGCDDCSANVEEREEHRKFLAESNARVREAALKEGYDKGIVEHCITIDKSNMEWFRNGSTETADLLKSVSDGGRTAALAEVLGMIVESESVIASQLTQYGMNYSLYRARDVKEVFSSLESRIRDALGGANGQMK